MASTDLSNRVLLERLGEDVDGSSRARSEPLGELGVVMERDELDKEGWSEGREWDDEGVEEEEEDEDEEEEVEEDEEDNDEEDDDDEEDDEEDEDEGDEGDEEAAERIKSSKVGFLLLCILQIKIKMWNKTIIWEIENIPSWQSV